MAVRERIVYPSVRVDPLYSIVLMVCLSCHNRLVVHRLARSDLPDDRDLVSFICCVILRNMSLTHSRNPSTCPLAFAGNRSSDREAGIAAIVPTCQLASCLDQRVLQILPWAHYSQSGEIARFVCSKWADDREALLHAHCCCAILDRGVFASNEVAKMHCQGPALGAHARHLPG